MTKAAQIEALEGRLRNVIQGTCNTVGCDQCGLKWPGGCSATDLDSKLLKLRMEPEPELETCTWCREYFPKGNGIVCPACHEAFARPITGAL